MEDYLDGLSPDVWRAIEVGLFVPAVLISLLEIIWCQPILLHNQADKKMIESDLSYKRELRYGIPLKIFSLIQSCNTAHDIWMKLKFMY